jgi:hypothetical protein
MSETPRDPAHDPARVAAYDSAADWANRAAAAPTRRTEA